MDPDIQKVNTVIMVCETNSDFRSLYQWIDYEFVNMGVNRWMNFWDGGVTYIKAVTTEGHPYPDFIFWYERE